MDEKSKEQVELEAAVLKALAPIMKRIGREDPYDRIIQYGWMTEAVRNLNAEASKGRRAAVRQLRAEGHTIREIAAGTGLTSGRISQIEFGYDRHEAKARRGA